MNQKAGRAYVIRVFDANKDIIGYDSIRTYSRETHVLGSNLKGAVLYMTVKDAEMALAELAIDTKKTKSKGRIYYISKVFYKTVKRNGKDKFVPVGLTKPDRYDFLSKI